MKKKGRSGVVTKSKRNHGYRQWLKRWRPLRKELVR